MLVAALVLKETRLLRTCSELFRTRGSERKPTPLLGFEVFPNLPNLFSSHEELNVQLRQHRITSVESAPSGQEPKALDCVFAPSGNRPEKSSAGSESGQNPRHCWFWPPNLRFGKVRVSEPQVRSSEVGYHDQPSHPTPTAHGSVHLASGLDRPPEGATSFRQQSLEPGKAERPDALLLAKPQEGRIQVV